MSSVLSVSPSPDEILNAPVPEAYANAQKALALCERIDECKSWSDKAQALASYARQAKDDSLRLYAIRIQARAQRRCGELLKQIEPANGARTDLGPVPTRGEAARDAGMSLRQGKTALRIASIPAADFDSVVDSPHPPSITQLASRGTQPRPAPVHTETVSGETRRQAKGALKAIEAFSQWCQLQPPTAIASAFEQTEIDVIRTHVGAIDGWLDVLVTNLQPMGALGHEAAAQ